MLLLQPDNEGLIDELIFYKSKHNQFPRIEKIPKTTVSFNRIKISLN